MADPDFSGLRTDVESATKVPDFPTITARARRVRFRDRVGSLAAVLAALAILVPIGVVSVLTQPRTGPQPLVRGQDPVPAVTTESAGPVSATYLAIAGSSRDNLYAAIDVCQVVDGRSRCSLQVTTMGLSAALQRPPLAYGQVRGQPHETLTDVSLVPLTPGYLLLSGLTGLSERVIRRINVGGGSEEMTVVSGTPPPPASGDRLVQITRYGPLHFARQSDDRIYLLPGQAPPVREPTVVTTIDPINGWWITGRDPAGDDLLVAVSHDRGASWTVRPLGLRSNRLEPVLATYDGRTAYAFMHTPDGVVQRRTDNGGQSWQEVPAHLPWPALASGATVVSRRLGVVVRPDRSLLVWLEDSPVAVFLESLDGGHTFAAANGPGGPIIPVADGYVSVSDPPKVSGDGRSWVNLPAPVYRTG